MLMLTCPPCLLIVYLSELCTFAAWHQVLPVATSRILCYSLHPPPRSSPTTLLALRMVLAHPPPFSWDSFLHSMSASLTCLCPLNPYVPAPRRCAPGRSSLTRRLDATSPALTSTASLSSSPSCPSWGDCHLARRYAHAAQPRATAHRSLMQHGRQQSHLISFHLVSCRFRTSSSTWLVACR